MYVEVKAKDYINEMVAEPIYDKHSKFASIRDRRKSNGTFVPPVMNKTCAVNTGTSEVNDYACSRETGFGSNMIGLGSKA